MNADSICSRVPLILLLCCYAGSLGAQDISFRKEIAPILLANCHGCHNNQTAEGNYRLESYASLLKPGESDATPIVSGQVEQSELLRRLVTEDEEERMPSEGDPLPAPTIELLRKWIDQGAPYDAQDRDARLASILPITRHPDPPKTYRFPIPVTAIAFVDDDLLVGGYHEILRWNWREQKIVSRIRQVGQRIYSMEYDEQSGRIYVGSGTPGELGEVRIVDGQSQQLVGVPLITNEVVFDVAQDPAGGRLAAAGADSKIHLIDLQQNRVVRSLDSHSDWVHAVAWREDGAMLASASRDKTAKLFDVASGRLKGNYAEHGTSVTDIVFVPGQSDRLVSCDTSGGLHFWNATDGEKTKEIPGKGGRAFRLLAMQGGVWLASSRDSVVQIPWDGEKELRSLDGQPEWVFALATDRDMRWLATGDLAGRVRIWDLATNALLAEFTAFP